MRKNVIRIIAGTAVLLAICLAGAGAAFAQTETDPPIAADIETASEAAMMDAAETAVALEPDSDMTVKAAAAGQEIPLDQAVTLNGTDPSFQLKIPSAGYLALAMVDAAQSDAVYARTRGFSSDMVFRVPEDAKVIAVKKGTYSFDVSTSAETIVVSARFQSYKESRYGKKKGKAPTIKKKKTQKGLMITGGQKTHWYKIKNPKNQKVHVDVESSMTDTGKGGGIRIVIYSGKQSLTYYNYVGNYSKTIDLYTIGLGKKLKKGTYYVKIQPYNKATGVFELKWK